MIVYKEATNLSPKNLTDWLSVSKENKKRRRIMKIKPNQRIKLPNIFTGIVLYTDVIKSTRQVKRFKKNLKKGKITPLMKKMGWG